MSGRVTNYLTPQPVSIEQMAEIEGRIQAGELYDENELLDVAEDLIATVRAMQQERDAARIETQTLRALLISRHGGEMLTLMQELDAAKEEITRLRRHLGEIP